MLSRMGLSRSERLFIKAGAEQNVRADGRQRLDYRYFSVKTGVVPNADGSARVKLDETDVLVGVNVEIGEPDPEEPNKGKIVCAVECAPSASPDFQGYGAADINVELSSAMQKFIAESNALPLESLALIPGKQCWILYVDALVLDTAGNLLDAIMLGAKAALVDAKIPVVKVVQGGSPDTLDIEVSDDPYEMNTLQAADVPITVTLTKIGPCFVADPTIEEELCKAAQLTVAIAPDGKICGTEKFGAGGITSAGLSEMLRCAKQIGISLHGQLAKAMEQAKADAPDEEIDTMDDVAVRDAVDDEDEGADDHDDIVMNEA